MGLGMTVSELVQQALAVLTDIHPAHATTGTVTRRLGGWPKVDGREVRVALDQLVESGQAVYLSGAGNNRSYRLAEVDHA